MVARVKDDSEDLTTMLWVASGSGEIEFEEFAAMVANFVVNGEDNEGLEEELREAFRLYDKQVGL